MLLSILAVTNILYINEFQPYQDSFSNKLEIANDIVAYLVALLSSSFFAAYPDAKQESRFKNSIQYWIISVISANLAINCILMIVQMVKDLYSALKSFLSTITEKIMNFRRKGIENNLMKKFPE